MTARLRKKACININFDSLFFPLPDAARSLRDPSYFEIADRFFAASERYGFRYTIFIIGRDLENPEVAARVRAWADAGHEIGNHTWSHHPNFGALPRFRVEDEILRSHEIIGRTTGKPPRGFISPSWSVSPDVIEILTREGYLYDTSIFPSPLIIPALLKLQVNARRHGSFDAAWSRRRDKSVPFCAPRHPYLIAPGSLTRRAAKGLLELPLPTTRLRVPCWHTMAFFLGPRRLRSLIRSAAADNRAFYYLVHPADLADWEGDIDPGVRSTYAGELAIFERLRVPLSRKRELFDAALAEIGSFADIVTLEEIARQESAVSAV